MIRAGFGTRELPVPRGAPLAGNGSLGRRAVGVAVPLRARALALEGPTGTVALVIADLMCATAALSRAVASRTPVPTLVAATHTHHGPGGLFDGGVHAWLSAARPATAEGVVGPLADAMADAVADAVRDLAPAEVALGEAACWGVSRRSWPAGEPLAADAPAGLPPAHRAVDPRVRALVFRSARGTRALVTFGAHATALGPRFDHAHPDWPGLAADALAGRGLDAVFGLSGAGDVNVLADDLPQGPALARRVAERVTAAAEEAVRRAVPVVASASALRSGTVDLTGGGRWAFGLAALGGAPDGATALHRLLRGGLRRAGPDPKVVVGGALARVLGAPGVVPVYVLDLGGVLVATAPGELTARAALALEAVRAGVPTLPLSYCGDYAGYLTTPEEYDLQRYEGASTLWGRDTLARLLAAHAALA